MAHNRYNQSSDALIQLAIKGWALPPSKWAANPDSGVSAVVSFLEKKSQRRIHSYKVVGKTHVLLIDIESNDAPRFYHLNGYTFSGAPIAVEDSKGKSQNQNQQNGNNRNPLGPGQENRNPPTGPRSNQQRYDNQTNSRPNQRNGADLINAFGNNKNSSFQSGNAFGQDQSNQRNQRNNKWTSDQENGQQEPQTKEAEELLAKIIRKRYQPQEKFLTLEELHADQDVVESGLIKAEPGKFWRALFTVCQKHVFETPTKRSEMVQSVSLARNNLKEVLPVIDLSRTFPDLKNLDLSDNQISNAGDLRFWRNAFHKLEHLIFTGNPIMDNTQELQKISRWYRTLIMLNREPLKANGMALDAPGLDTSGSISRTDSPAVNIPPHPEVVPGTKYAMLGQPEPGKSEETLLKEQMGLKISFDTRLKLAYVEQLLGSTNFDYNAAMQRLGEAMSQGLLPPDAFH